MDRVLIQWSGTAKAGLAKLPPDVRRGLIGKINELSTADDPKAMFKPLFGPLSGYQRVCFSRYRAIYAVEEEPLPSGDTLLKLTVHFIAIGKASEANKADVYRIAQRLAEIGMLDVEDDNKRTA